MRKAVRLFQLLSGPARRAIVPCFAAALLIAPHALAQVNSSPSTDVIKNSAPATQPSTQPSRPAIARGSERAQPKRSPWTTTVTAFANALVDSSDSSTVEELVNAGAN